MRVTRPQVLALALAATFALAGCGDDEKDSAQTGTATTEEQAAPAGKAAQTIKVSETEFELDPANPKVSKTGVVEFDVSNDGQTDHALEVEGPGEEVHTDTIAPGESAKLKVDLSKPGTYEWYCPIGNHKGQGMEGEINVLTSAGNADGGSSTSEDETTTDETETESGDDKSGSGGY